jgi:hypothetical protein
MYDTVLRDDLLNLRKGAYTIDTVQYNNAEMKKIIKCRTRDKIDLLNLLLAYKVIDYDYYKELIQIVENDFKMGYLYLLGQCQI